MRRLALFLSVIVTALVSAYSLMSDRREPAREALQGSSPTTSETGAAAPPPQDAPAAQEGAPAPAPIPRAPAERTDADRAAAKAAQLAANERLSREEVREFLQEALAGKLADRELTPVDYEQLTDAVLKLRAAQRVARGLEENRASAESRTAYREALLDALSEIERITGLPSTDLDDIFPSEGGLTNERDDNPEEIFHDTLPEDPPR